MRPAATVTELMADPVGRYVGGRAFVAWVLSPSQFGVSHFGAFDPADTPAYQQLIHLPRHAALAPPLDVIHDIAGVATLDRAAFDAFVQLVSLAITQLETRARRVAVVRPSGLPGAAFTGLFHDWTTGYEGKLFESRADALAWLGITGDTRAEVDAVHAPFEAPPVLRRVRELLAADPATTLDAIAVAVAHSARSLQRHLADAGTSFRDELAAARIAAAKHRLGETDDKIEAIARDLGFASVAAFTTMFGKAVGETPLAYRQRNR